ncbi:MAG: hypothetical protein FWG65_04260 [Turicibacter sp.]|nr:hypothetical protein [Turicibacter sp.]
MSLGQSGANSATRRDIVAIHVDIAVLVDIGGIVRVVARRPQPPPRSRSTKSPNKRHSLINKP